MPGSTLTPSQAINLHYAQKHGYEYVMFCEGNVRNMSAAWLKVAAMEWLVERARAQQTPTYILFLDSDAFVRAMDTRLEDWCVARPPALGSRCRLHFLTSTSPGPCSVRAVPA